MSCSDKWIDRKKVWFLVFLIFFLMICRFLICYFPYKNIKGNLQRKWLNSSLIWPFSLSGFLKIEENRNTVQKMSLIHKKSTAIVQIIIIISNYKFSFFLMTDVWGLQLYINGILFSFTLYNNLISNREKLDALKISVASRHT